MNRDCEHGQLARSCSICDLERELKAVRNRRTGRDIAAANGAERMTAITMPKGRPDDGAVFFVYRAKVDTGSSMHTAGVITEEQHRAICLILQGMYAFYDGADK